MFLTDHLLSGPQVSHDFIAGGAEMTVRRCAVIHFTGGATGRSSVEFWKSTTAKGACAHLVIERDGQVIQCRRFNRTAGHAGASRWQDPRPDGKLWRGLNTCSIGIELANAGSDADALAWARKHHPGFNSIKARHPNGGRVMEWEAFYSEQLASLYQVLSLLIPAYRLDDITGHDCIAPERKDDPGPAFPMLSVRSKFGFPGLPLVNR